MVDSVNLFIIYIKYMFAVASLNNIIVLGAFIKIVGHSIDLQVLNISGIVASHTTTTTITAITAITVVATVITITTITATITVAL